MGQPLQQDEGSFSVTAVAEAVGVCRDRFYELVSCGVFPPPAYDLRTRRPFYTHWLRSACLTVRASGIGFDGRRVLFNRTKRSRRPAVKRPRTRSPTTARPSAGSRRPTAARDEHEQLARQLRLLGVQQVDAAAVAAALALCFPAGTHGVAHAVIVHRLRQHPWPATA